ncbi:MAG: hypothetical protein ACRDRO_18535 [Pseudonocardiaceae bacterium]
MRTDRSNLNTTCRILRQILVHEPTPAMRQAAPELVAAFPVLRELVDGVEDLADRVVILEGVTRRQRA